MTFVVRNLIVLEIDSLRRVGPHGESPYNLIERKLYSKTPLAKGKERIGGFGNKGAFEGHRSIIHSPKNKVG
jgi:hypothetical protein